MRAHHVARRGNATVPPGVAAIWYPKKRLAPLSGLGWTAWRVIGWLTR
jgi:hypothetical protein